MFTPILNAIGAGYTANQVLGYVTRRYPQFANYIQHAAVAGYATNTILKSLNKDDDSPNADAYLTENEWLKRDNQKKRSTERKYLAGGIAGAAALAGGAGYLLSGRGAINPSQILPAAARGAAGVGGAAGQTINVTPNAPIRPNIGGGQARQIPQQQGNRPWNRHSTPVKPNTPLQLTNQQRQVTQQAARQPPPIQPRPTKPGIQTPEVIAPPFDHNPQTNINLITNLKEDKRIAQAVTSGLAPAAVLQVLRETIPKSKLALLDRAEGGFEQAINDFTQYKQHEIAKLASEEKRTAALGKFNQNKSLSQTEADRFNKKYPKPLIQSQEIGNEELQPDVDYTEEFDEEPISEEQNQPIQPIISAQMRPEGDVEKRVKEASRGNESPKTLAETKELNYKRFSIPNYRYPGEAKEEFDNRKLMFDAINKASHALVKGKSFLDYMPINKEGSPRVQISTAADVLRFMAGIPNIYDPLLDDSEREEISEALLESGQMSTPGLKPGSGERDIYGAQMTPNLVWNLLLAVEPRLYKMEKPPSIKGYKMAPGKKMGTAELRRFLTHSVYGVLSGRTISSELAEKIEKISNATASHDAIVKATKAGNVAKMEAEMEKLAKDDPYFLEMMDIELDDLLLTADQRERQRLRDIEDTKGAASLKASATRKKKKAESQNED